MLKIILTVLSVLYAVPSISSEWVPVKNTGLYFDISRIKKDEKTGDLFVWKKFVMPDSEVKKLQLTTLKNNWKLDFSNYGWTVTRNGINCKNESTYLLSLTYYADSGDAIYTKTYNAYEERQNSSVVTPDSIQEVFLNTVCEYVANPNKTKKSGR